MGISCKDCRDSRDTSKTKIKDNDEIKNIQSTNNFININNFPSGGMKIDVDMDRYINYPNLEIPSETELKINDFCRLKDKLMIEIKGIKRRKNDFLIKYKAVEDTSFTYSNNMKNRLNNELNKIENAFIDYKQKLNSFLSKIEKKIESHKFNESPTYDQLKYQIENEFNNQNEIETQFIREKNNYIQEDYNDYINNQNATIHSKLDKLNNFGEKIIEIKNNFEYCFENCQNIINLINQKEKDIKSKFKFMANDIKIERKISKILEEKRDKIIIQSNIINNKIEHLNQIYSKINSLNNQIRSYNNFESDKEFEIQLKLLEDLENEAIKEIEDANKDDICLLISKINSEVTNIENNTLYIISNSFYDKEEEGDSTYNKLIKKEKNIMNKIIFEQRKKVIDIIVKDNKLNSIPNLNYNLIKNIVINEDSYNNFKNKIIEKINYISKDKEKFKIENLNILLVGRKEADIPTLIKYILGEDLNIYKYNDNFIEYTNPKLNLKLIKAKEIDYDADRTIDVIEKNIKDFINNANNNKDIKDYNNVIHCIWYCITKARFEGKEKDLFFSLKNLYKDNIIPMILVYTKANDRILAKDMENQMKTDYKIDNSFIPVLAKNFVLTNKKQKSAFGKELLLKTTLEKCAKALQSDLLKIMVQQIATSIKNNLITENTNIAEDIKNKPFIDFYENFKDAYENGDFIKYIVSIFFKYLKDFYHEEKIISNKSKNLFFKSDFITYINNIYNSYMIDIDNLIEPIALEKSKEFLDIQATLEKKDKNINIINKRILSQFQTTTKIYLKMNFYYIIQNYIVYHLIQTKKYFYNYLSLITNEFSQIIHNLTDLNNKEKDFSYIRELLYDCYKKN